MFKTIFTYSSLFNRYLDDGHKISLDTHNDIFLLILPLMFSNIDKENQEDLALLNDLILFFKLKKDGFETAFNNQQKNLGITKKNASFASSDALDTWYQKYQSI